MLAQKEGYDDDSLANKKDLLSESHDIISKGETLWRQISITKCLREEDKNFEILSSNHPQT